MSTVFFFLCVRTLPTKNSLLGWVQAGKLLQMAQTEEAIDWACSVCTLVNRAAAVTCDACMTKRERNLTPDVIKQDSKFLYRGRQKD